MKIEQTGYGLTIEQAYEEAKTNLILSLGARKYNEDDIQFDIIEMPKKKTLGLFGGCKAEVNAYIELPDEPKPKAKKPSKAKNNENKRSQKNEKTDKATATPVEKPEVKTVNADEIAADTPTGRAIAYLKNILVQLGCTDTVIKVAERDNGAALYLSGEGLGVVIGHRGETLDALQYLTSLAANNVGGYFKVTINIGDYRERRELALTSLANRIANQVIRTGRNRTLEPMNPYERRIIHTAVQNIDGVTSHSVGEGSGRRVVISSTNKTPRRNGSKPATQKVEAEAREPKRDAELPLYGKIN